MANWSELPLDIAIEIGEKIEYYEDFIRLGVVCKNWRHATKLADPPSASRQTPWLLFTEPPDDGDAECRLNGRLYSIDKESFIRQLDLPYKPSTQLLEDDTSIDLRPLFVQETWTYFSTRGWLVYIDETIHDVVLVHPVSKEIIQCPPIPYELAQEISECTSRDNPPKYDDVMFSLSDTPSSTYQYSLAMIFNGYNIVAVWHSTENEWLVRKFPNNEKIMDIVFYKGNLYFVDMKGKVVGFESEKAINLERPWPVERWAGSVYLVESDGKLLMVRRKLGYDKQVFIKTLSFNVWEVNIEEGHTKEVNDLGNNALFLGYNSCFSINTSISCVLPNCIYYVGDYGYAKDMGIYDLCSMEKIQDHYDPSDLSIFIFPPPLWIEATN